MRQETRQCLSRTDLAVGKNLKQEKNMKKKAGFTLVEIMIVVAIIGLLAAIAIPSFVQARNTSRQNACINNLRQIESAKEQLAMAENLPSDAAYETDFDDEDLDPYIRGGVAAATDCPAGGTVTIGDLEEYPDCTEDGHTIDPDAEE